MHSTVHLIISNLCLTLLTGENHKQWVRKVWTPGKIKRSLQHACDYVCANAQRTEIQKLSAEHKSLKMHQSLTREYGALNGVAWPTHGRRYKWFIGGKHFIFAILFPSQCLGHWIIFAKVMGWGSRKEYTLSGLKMFCLVLKMSYLEVNSKMGGG